MTEEDCNTTDDEVNPSLSITASTNDRGREEVLEYWRGPTVLSSRG